MKELSLGTAATLACLLEVSVPKVGNVHRSADFEDSTFYDFIVSAVAVGEVFARADQLSVGELVFQSIDATQALVGTNTNLGMVLLMAPLAKCTSPDTLADVQRVLDELNSADCHEVLKAIRLANPGGMGEVETHDFRETDLPDDVRLTDLMALAAERDLVARQYANGYREIREIVIPALVGSLGESVSLPDGIVHAHLQVMAELPDTLIARKCGRDVAIESSVRAGRIVHEHSRGSESYFSAIADLDFWLRSDGHQRNPGTSADLIAAGLFYCLRNGVLPAAQIRSLLDRTNNSNRYGH